MNKPIRYSNHLVHRLHVREFDSDLPRAIIEAADDQFRDLATGNDIAIGRAEYAGRLRELAVAFVEKTEYIVITIHPLKPGQKDRRVSAGRWVIK